MLHIDFLIEPEVTDGEELKRKEGENPARLGRREERGVVGVKGES